MDDETTQWMIKTLRELADRMEREDILLKDFDNPSCVIDTTPPMAAAIEWTFTGEHSLIVNYTDVDKPTFMKRGTINENR